MDRTMRSATAFKSRMADGRPLTDEAAPTATAAAVGVARPQDDTGAPDPQASFRRFRRLVPWAVGLSVATLVGLSVWFQARGQGDVLAELQRVEIRALAAALALHLLMQVAWACRIFVLGRGLGAPVRMPRALALVTSGLFAAAVTPGRVGGEPWRIAILVRGGASGAAASRTILADRAVDMLFFLTLGVLALALLPSFFGDVGNVQVLGAVALVGLLAIIVALTLALVRPGPMARALAGGASAWDRIRGRERVDRAPRIRAFFHDITAGIAQLLRDRPLALVAAALLSFLLWTCELSVLWVVLNGFGFDPPYWAAYLAGVIIVMVASVPALPGGTGVAEVAALALLTPLAPGLGPAFLVAWRGMTYYVDLLAGGLVAAWVARRAGAATPPPGTAG